jgi:hypothetical protein
MKKTFIFIIGVIFLISMISAYDFVGVKKCRMCHKGEKKGNVFEKWVKGPHANAFQKLKAKGEEKNPKCLACHVTGFNQDGYKLGADNAAKFEGVQCESCHGPGSDYKKLSIMKDKAKAMENGLLAVNEATCTKCHNKKSPDFKGFNYQEYLKKINHIYRKK